MMKDRHKARTRVFLITLLIIEIIIICATLISIKKSDSHDYDGNYSGEMEFAQDGWQLSEASCANKEAREVLRVEYPNLPAGLYSGTIRYQTDQIQEVSVESWLPEYVEMEPLYLDHRKDRVDFYIHVKAPVDPLRIMIKFRGGESLRVAPFTLHASRRKYVKDAVCALLILIAIQIITFLSYKYPNKKNVIASILGISILALLPYLFYGIHFGHDLPFHYNRIEGLADALRDGQFPVYMQPLWMNG